MPAGPAPHSTTAPAVSRTAHGEASETPPIRNPKLRRFNELLGELNVHELAAARTMMRRRELSANNHYFNSARPLDHLRKYVDAAPDVVTADRLANARVLEFGSGTRNANSLAALLFLNGAAHVACYEPGKVNAEQSALALRELLADVIADPDRFALAQVSPTSVRDRAFELLAGGTAGRLDLVESRDALEAVGERFDLVISNHVLEHVDDIAHELELLDRLASPTARQVHRVDFRDHRVFSQPAAGHSPFQFYLDGVLTTCNGLRPSDFDRAFAAHGWRAVRVGEQRADPEQVPERRHERFGEYALADLDLLGVDWVLERATA